MPDAYLKSNSTCGLILNYPRNFPQVSQRLPAGFSGQLWSPLGVRVPRRKAPAAAEQQRRAAGLQGAPTPCAEAKHPSPAGFGTARRAH